LRSRVLRRYARRTASEAPGEMTPAARILFLQRLLRGRQPESAVWTWARDRSATPGPLMGGQFPVRRDRPQSGRPRGRPWRPARARAQASREAAGAGSLLLAAGCRAAPRQRRRRFARAVAAASRHDRGRRALRFVRPTRLFSSSHRVVAASRTPRPTPPWTSWPRSSRRWPLPAEARRRAGPGRGTTSSRPGHVALSRYPRRWIARRSRRRSRTADPSAPGARAGARAVSPDTRTSSRAFDACVARAGSRRRSPV